MDDQGDLFYEAMKRPPNYKQMSSARQWEVDGALGILDWDGSCPHMSGAPCDKCEKQYHDTHPRSGRFKKG